MNSKTFLTHHKGIALKTMSRDDVIDVLQHYYRLYHTSMADQQRLLQKGGTVVIDSYEGRSPF